MRIEHVHVGEGAQAVIGNVQPGRKADANQSMIQPEQARTDEEAEELDPKPDKG